MKKENIWKVIVVIALGAMAKINTIITFVQNTQKMPLEIIQIIFQILFFSIIIYFVYRLLKSEEVTQKKVDNKFKEFDLFIIICNTILTRKTKHIYRCLTSGKILTMPKLLTDLENKLYNELSEKYKSKIDDILKDIPENEHH